MSDPIKYLLTYYHIHIVRGYNMAQPAITEKSTGYRAILAKSFGGTPDRVGEVEPTTIPPNRPKRRN